MPAPSRWLVRRERRSRSIELTTAPTHAPRSPTFGQSSPALPTKLKVKGPGGRGAPTIIGYRVSVTSKSKTEFSIDRNGDTVTFPCKPVKACSGGYWN